MHISQPFTHKVQTHQLVCNFPAKLNTKQLHFCVSTCCLRDCCLVLYSIVLLYVFVPFPHHSFTRKFHMGTNHDSMILFFFFCIQSINPSCKTSSFLKECQIINWIVLQNQNFSVSKLRSSLQIVRDRIQVDSYLDLYETTFLLGIR